jgi:hypothetical protein
MAKAPAALLVFILMLLIMLVVPVAAEVEDRMDKLVTVTVAVMVLKEMLAAVPMVGALGVMDMLTAINMTITLLQAVAAQFVSSGLEIHVNSHQLALVLRNSLTIANLSQDTGYGKYIL